MKGALLFNGSVSRESIHETRALFLNASARLGCELETVFNNEFTTLLAHDTLDIRRHGAPYSADFFLCLDKDHKLIAQCERAGFPTFNRSEAIIFCDDKWLNAVRASEHGIPMPKTLLGPMNYAGLNPDDAWLAQAADTLGFPLVLKECFGSYGKQVYLCRNDAELRERIAFCGARPFLVQEAVCGSFGRDMRIHVVGDDVVAATLRTSRTDFRANASQGGTMTPIRIDDALRALAVRCSAAFGAFFSGIDFLFDDNDEPIFCEINSNPHIVNITNATGIDVATETLARVMDRTLAG